ncbi:UNVERIFIED_CONTAM: hypothetical protein K2H54_061128 [Gekko kuhli]
MTSRQDPGRTTEEQYASVQMPVVKEDPAKDSERNLKDKTQNSKKCVDEPDREVDTVQVEKLEKKIQMLENRDRKLTKDNEQLNMVLEMFPKIFKDVIVKLQRRDRDYEPEKVIACHLRDSQEKLNEGLQRNSKLHKNKHVMISVAGIKNIPVVEQEEDQAFPELREGATLEEDSVINAKPSKPLHDISDWDLAKRSLGIVLGFGFCLCLILLCAYYFNRNFIANSLILMLYDHDVAGMTQLLSPYFIWQNNGLLPF